jgi:salicylate hydroxylase
VAHIPDLAVSTSWWHGPSGHVYHSMVDDPEEVDDQQQMFEIAARNVVDPETVAGQKQFSWGIPATKERVESHFTVSNQFEVQCWPS